MLKKIVVAGTFDILHAGHRKLIGAALASGKKVMLGLTSDEFAEKIKGYPSKPFAERKRGITAFIGKSIGRVDIFELNDVFGPAASDGELEGIVVSSETRENAEKINKIRSSTGLKSLEIIEIPIVMADDGKPLSCERIRQGEIDENGRSKY